MVILGCASRPAFAPVEERSAASSRRIQYHIVSPGETLFSIAWAYGLDYSGLATANSIVPPYTIYPGQKLLLVDPSKAAARANKGALPHDEVRLKAVGEVDQARRRSGKKMTLREVVSRPMEEVLDFWRWPAKGAVAVHFGGSRSAHKGIDIRGELGEPVYAANNGTVVYAGDGLVGYGNLLIIRHSDHYLSAYAHNSKLLANEGQFVKAGDRIAEIGDSGTDLVKLHFEIRRDGEPIDPLSVLPSR